jgi:hypothetical protein
MLLNIKFEISKKSKEKQEKQLINRKILHLLHSSDNNFLLYLKRNSKNEKLLTVVSAIIRRRNVEKLNSIIKGHNNNYFSKKYFLNALTLCRRENLGGNTIKQCFCYFYPFSTICRKLFCSEKENKFNYFCDEKYCFDNKLDMKNCSCSIDPQSQECRCLLNPLSKECFCLKYKRSLLCHNDFCKDPKNNHLFCICQRNMLSKECLPNYCEKHLNDTICECLKDPLNRDCICEVYSELNECKDQYDIIKSKYSK